MALTIDYFFAPQSPWSYLGHSRLRQIASRAGATINVLPVDLGRVFPLSGGLPLAKRAPQRQSYRLLELRRFSDFLDLPLNVQPRYFPVNADDAAKLIVAVEMNDGSEAALRIAEATMRAVWVDQQNIADPTVLQSLLERCALPAIRLEDAQRQSVHERYADDSQRAIDAGVFGAPTYMVAGEMFWGQDRL
ncbi:MAG: 2-hydroxychromene-2-carboxylate isomerase, partial [Pseudomonadota bacterium]|nr:2-hydroxychromene-2-carboxylate isomerase [Pseudomonadota bacterium]